MYSLKNVLSMKLKQTVLGLRKKVHLKLTQGKQQENPLIYLFLLFLFLWRTLIWIAAASWVWAVWGWRGGGGGGRWGRAVTAAVAVIWGGAGGVTAVWRWVTGGAIWITAAVAGVFSPERWSGRAQKGQAWTQKPAQQPLKYYTGCGGCCPVTWQRRREAMSGLRTAC